MISILNRRELYTGTDAEDAARVWSTLKAEGIAYKMQTKGVRSSLAQGRRAGMGMGMTGGALLGLCRRRELRLHHLRKKFRPRPREGAPGALSTLTGFEAARRFVPRGFSLALCVPLWDRSYTRRRGEWLGKGKCRPSGGIFD